MIIDLKKEILSLHRVPCNIKLIEYTETIGTIDIDKVAIVLDGHTTEANKLREYEYSNYGVIMYQEQYDTIFKPLFEHIGNLNHQIAELQDKVRKMN